MHFPFYFCLDSKLPTHGDEDLIIIIFHTLERGAHKEGPLCLFFFFFFFEGCLDSCQTAVTQKIKKKKKKKQDRNLENSFLLFVWTELPACKLNQTFIFVVYFLSFLLRLFSFLFLGKNIAFTSA